MGDDESGFYDDGDGGTDDPVQLAPFVVTGNDDDGPIDSGNDDGFDWFDDRSCSKPGRFREKQAPRFSPTARVRS